MKKAILLSIILAGTTINILMAQSLNEKDIPDAVKILFAKSFPNSTHVSWKKHKKNFQTFFADNETKNLALFDKTGVLLETKMWIHSDSLPENVITNFNQKYKHAVIIETYKIIKENGEIFFMIHANECRIFFDAKGNFIKKERD